MRETSSDVIDGRVKRDGNLFVCVLVCVFVYEDGRITAANKTTDMMQDGTDTEQTTDTRAQQTELNGRNVGTVCGPGGVR